MDQHLPAQRRAGGRQHRAERSRRSADQSQPSDGERRVHQLLYERLLVARHPHGEQPSKAPKPVAAPNHASDPQKPVSARNPHEMLHDLPARHSCHVDSICQPVFWLACCSSCARWCDDASWIVRGLRLVFEKCRSRCRTCKLAARTSTRLATRPSRTASARSSRSRCSSPDPGHPASPGIKTERVLISGSFAGAAPIEQNELA